MWDNYITRCHRGLGSVPVAIGVSWGTRCQRENQLADWGLAVLSDPKSQTLIASVCFACTKFICCRTVSSSRPKIERKKKKLVPTGKGQIVYWRETKKKDRRLMLFFCLLAVFCVRDCFCASMSCLRICPYIYICVIKATCNCQVTNLSWF